MRNLLIQSALVDNVHFIEIGKHEDDTFQPFFCDFNVCLNGSPCIDIPKKEWSKMVSRFWVTKEQVQDALDSQFGRLVHFRIV